jgi:hypothetical protein
MDLLTLSSSHFDRLRAFARTKSRSAATSCGLISPCVRLSPWQSAMPVNQVPPILRSLADEATT